MMMPNPPSNADQTPSKGDLENRLAAKWATCSRTIRNWKAEGAPVDDDGAMRIWLLGRPKVPRGTAELLRVHEGQRSVRPPKPKRIVVAPTSVAPPNGEGVLGVSGALQRLAEAERSCHDEWRQLVANPEASIEQIEAANQQWIKTGDSLRRYDLAVEQDRRQSGELLPRSDLESFAEGFVTHFVSTLRSSLEAACPRLAGLESPQAVWQVLSAVLTRAVDESATSAQQRPYAGHSCPSWLSQ
jgi:hypothetical protein